MQKTTGPRAGSRLIRIQSASFSILPNGTRDWRGWPNCGKQRANNRFRPCVDHKFTTAPAAPAAFAALGARSRKFTDENHFGDGCYRLCAHCVERKVAGIAVDTLSLDNGPSREFKTHKLWLPSGRWGLENVANLGKVPAGGATLVVGAPKVKDATGGLTRVLALV
jgi:hypothetical protein